MVTLRAQAEAGHPGLLLSMAHKTFYNMAKPGLPSLSGFSRLPRHHAPLLSQFPAFAVLFPLLSMPFPPSAPCHFLFSSSKAGSRVLAPGSPSHCPMKS